MNLFSIFTMSMLTENIVLTKFLGICPFIGTSKKEKSALGMGLSLLIVILVTSILTYLIYYYVLLPTNTIYLRTIMFILIIAFIVQLTILVLRKYFKIVYEMLGIYLPLITTNCAVLGTNLLNINSGYNFIEMMIFSLGSGLGFLLILYVFSTIREYLETKNIPNSFKGYPISFIVAGIMALLFGRFN